MTTETLLMARVRNRCNLNAADHRVQEADLRIFLNDAINYLAVQSDWPWHRAEQSLSITADTRNFTLGTAPRVLKNIVIESEDQVLDEITTKRAGAYFTIANGRPLFFTWSNNSIDIFPKANKAYTATVQYLKYPDQLTTGTDEVDSPDTFDALIVTRAAMYVAEKIRDSEMAQRMEITFRRELEEMMAMANDTRSPIGVNIRDDWLL